MKLKLTGLTVLFVSLVAPLQAQEGEGIDAHNGIFRLGGNVMLASVQA